MSDEEVDPILQVPLAVTKTTSTLPEYSIPPKVLYALDPKRRLVDDLHLKLIAEEQMQEEEEEITRKSDSGCILSKVKLAFFRASKQEDLEQRYRELRANDIKVPPLYLTISYILISKHKQQSTNGYTYIPKIVQGEASARICSWVGLTFVLAFSLSSQFCLGRWKFGRIGWAPGQVGGTSEQMPPCKPSSYIITFMSLISIYEWLHNTLFHTAVPRNRNASWPGCRTC